MVDVKLEIRDEMDSLRDTLYTLLASEGTNNESILKVSEELDKLIIKYIKAP